MSTGLGKLGKSRGLIGRVGWRGVWSSTCRAFHHPLRLPCHFPMPSLKALHASDTFTFFLQNGLYRHPKEDLVQPDTTLSIQPCLNPSYLSPSLSVSLPPYLSLHHLAPLFRYEALKGARGQYDQMDLTHHIWRQLQQHGYHGPQMEVRKGRGMQNFRKPATPFGKGSL